MKTLTFVVSWPVLTGPKKFPHSTLVCSILHLPDCLTEQTSCFKNSDILHLLLQELWSFAPYTSRTLLLLYAPYSFNNFGLLHLHMLQELWSFAPYVSSTLIFCTLCFKNYVILHLMLQELWSFAPYASRTLILWNLLF